ncbi:MAG: alpha/beta fold hydrolase, partial [Actinobacteria bacterium]|nr:alpha/beta fold hydrolase [Actinomycetota bacterium]
MKLHVHEWGDADAPPVVCLHGVTAHGERYKQLAEERWARHFRVIAFDLRGHARSRWEPPFDFATHVDDLVETVDALGLDRPDWVGHSFGGRLVLELAARHPERIRRAVLLDPAIDILPHVAEFMAEVESRDPIVES